MTLLIIGIDGATYRVIDDNRERLPTIDNLISDGFSARLSSTLPSTTSVAWPAMATGKNPGQYGIFDFMGRNPRTMEFYLNDVRQREMDYFWEYMEESIGLASIPVIPYHSTDGYFVQGSLARINSEQIVTPSSIGLPEYYDYRFHWRDDPDQILNGISKRIEARRELFVQLVRDHDVPMHFVMFNAIDHIQHHFWSYMDETHPLHEESGRYSDGIVNAYEQIDAAISDIVSAAGEETTVVLVSDHGFKPCHTDININALLHDREFLTYDIDTSDRAFLSVTEVAKKYLTDSMTGLIPDAIKTKLKEKTPANTGIKNAIDWSNTQAYTFGAMPNIYFNLEGRERTGIVAPSEYKKLCEEIANELEGLEVNGEKPIKRVHRGKEIYEGPYAEYAPDLTLETAEGFYCFGNHGMEIVNVKQNHMPNTGVHEREGIFVTDGPEISANSHGSRPEHDIQDVAPTVLTLYGYSPPDAMDGSVMKTAIRDVTTTELGEKSEKQRIRNSVLALKQVRDI